MARIVVVLLVFGVGIGIAFFMLKGKEEPLPYFNPTDMEADVVDSALYAEQVGQGHTIGDFSFLDQRGKTVTEADIEGKVFVAEYFFTTCGSICPVMNVQMQRVQEAFVGEKDFRILSFTVHPEVDTVEQMQRYAKDHGAIPGKWFFLTGDKKELYALARKSFFVLKPAEAQNLGDAGGDFIHTNNFVLVDREKHIRGYYDGTNPKEVDRLIHDIERLLAK
jgi:protein SCO1/2